MIVDVMIVDVTRDFSPTLQNDVQASLRTVGGHVRSDPEWCQQFAIVAVASSL
jgi:hypothetical protein